MTGRATRATTLVLPRAFYARPTLAVAEDLIGKVLVHRVRGRPTAGIIVEVEAYIGESDPACHAAPGPTRRNAPLYGEPGYAYVYLNYGIHYLVNVVTEASGSPAAILIRALEPIEGLELMRRRRLRKAASSAGIADVDLCRGPGNLTVAMSIDLKQNTADLVSGALSVEDRGIRTGTIAWSPRIGIRVGTDRHWRCAVSEHDGVSGRVRRRKRGSEGLPTRACAAEATSARRGSGKVL
jgi:DNA-3-methyladenine glycosylase